MSRVAGPRRPPIRRSKDFTPVIMAILAVMVLPALGFAVYKFVIKKDPLPEQMAAVTRAPTNVADTMPTPEERGIAPLPKLPVTAPALPAKRPDLPPPNEAAFNEAMNAFNSSNAFTGAPYSAPDPFNGSPTNFGSAGRVMNASNLAAGAAVEKTMKKIKESADLGKTLVIWLIDRSPSCEQRRRDVIQQVTAAYPTLVSNPPKDNKPENAPLLSVVCSFASDVSFITPDPTGDVEAVKKAFNEIGGEGGTVENTFQAVEAAVTKFASYAAPPHQRYISVVVVTDEVGDDQMQRDRVVDLVRKNSVPVYVIGQAAAFGSTGATESSPEGSMGRITGPESREVENISLSFPGGGGGYSMMGGGMMGPQECSIGPYSLSHLCRESGGEFFAVGGGGSGIALPPQYAPKYMSEKDYQAQVGGNKAIQALYAASRLKPAQQISGPATSFSVDENGLAVVRDIDNAMRPIALIMPQINDLFDTLKKGESDRAKLTEPRHQAAFDTAIGRAMAAKVRAEGYIVLMAAFKAGRKTTKPGASGWALQPGTGIEKNSVLDSMAKKSREYLEGVIKNHPNTPWAAAAQQELMTPIGWVWQEY